MDKLAYMPTTAPFEIGAGKFKGEFAISYRDEHGLTQTHFPFVSPDVAWKYAMSLHAKQYKIPLQKISLSNLRLGDLVLNADYALIQITELPAPRQNIMNETYYSAVGVFARELPRPGIQILLKGGSCFAVPETIEDYVS